jgi:hypothetical protein
MSVRTGAAFRVLTVLLLALAVSPLTAPFATAQPAQLFGTADPDDGPLFGARKAVDDPVAGLIGKHLFARLDELAGNPVSRGAEGLPRGVDSLHQPLRI